MADFQPDLTPPGTTALPLGSPVPAPTRAAKAAKPVGRRPSKRTMPPSKRAPRSLTHATGRGH